MTTFSCPQKLMNCSYGEWYRFLTFLLDNRPSGIPWRASEEAIDEMHNFGVPEFFTEGVTENEARCILKRLRKEHRQDKRRKKLTAASLTANPSPS